MINQQTDTDATGAFVVGVGRSDQPQDFRTVQPNWIADGYGVRGPQRAVTEERATPRELSMGQAVGQQRADTVPSSGACAPTPRDPEETGTWVWGSVDGVCQWINTIDCP